jgi:two-component system, LytTR family, sensor kinase
VAAFTFSFVHWTGMMGTRSLLWPNAGKPPDWTWASFAQRIYLNNLDWSLMTYTTVVGLAYALWFHRESQQSALTAAHLETRLMETRLRTLEAELHPHFLFNTLHAISTLMHRDVESADRMLSRLSELLRLTLNKVGQQEVTLSEEVDFLAKYLQIEQTRFQDRLTVRFDVEADALDGLVPRMLLQPLVENAIKHGIAPQPGPGEIAIVAHRDGGRLLLEVRDNGVGLSQDSLTALQSGIGLSTTRARLQHLFGRDYQFEFLRQPRGLTVRVVLPWRGAEPSVELKPASVA